MGTQHKKSLAYTLSCTAERMLNLFNISSVTWYIWVESAGGHVTGKTIV